MGHLILCGGARDFNIVPWATLDSVVARTTSISFHGPAFIPYILYGGARDFNIVPWDHLILGGGARDFNIVPWTTLYSVVARTTPISWYSLVQYLLFCGGTRAFNISAPLTRGTCEWFTVNTDHYCTGLQCADITGLTRLQASQAWTTQIAG